MKPKPKRERILAVDDSADTLDALLQNLAAEGYQAVGAPGAAEALELLARGTYEFVITDMKMPGMGGMELVEVVRERYPESEIMMITGYATIEGAVEAVKTGAEEYLSKPFTLEELFAALDRLREKRRRRKDSRRVPRPHLGLVGESDAMRRVLAAVELAARNTDPVLILGEPGSGRGAVARAVATLRGRGDLPFAVLDPLAARGVLESGLLGGEARSAEIYLPDVDFSGPEALAALGELVAGHALLPAHLYLSAGSDLPRLVEAGVFPRDLNDLLSAHSISLPPLRERGGDVVHLAEHFLGLLAQRAGAGLPRLSEPVHRALLSYPWPGNVAELRGEMTRAFLRRRGEAIEPADLSSHVRRAADSSTQRTLAQAEEDHIQRVLASVGGHRGKAAEILRIDRKTLRERLGPKASTGHPAE